MALRRPCKAAFSLTPRWRKRVDGQNVYDGRPFTESVKRLHLHDCPIFRRDFDSLLTRREKIMLALRETTYRLRLLLHEATENDLAERLKIPALVAKLRRRTDTFMHNSEQMEHLFVEED